MKLNSKRTILVGLAFLSICAFWQMYDSIVPLILTKTFHMNETFSGAIMAADNILALFLLPFFGSVSDKSHTKIGKRMPFILFGTGCAILTTATPPSLPASRRPHLSSSSACCSSPWERTALPPSPSCPT
mgnify:CR=1 FL=1